MKFSCEALLSFSLLSTSLLSSPTFAAAAADSSAWQPRQISYETLLHSNQQDDDLLLDALEQVGMVSITGIPNLHKQAMLKSLKPCLEQSSTSSTATSGTAGTTSTSATQDVLLSDGQTRRRTWATRPEVTDSPLLAETKDCQDFEQASQAFRSQAGQVTNVFAQRLTSLLMGAEEGDRPSEPLLQTREGRPFDSFQDVVQQGQHLEHFHSYYTQEHDTTKTSGNAIEWHTDQGLFIVFTPALMVGSGSVPSELAAGFQVLLPDGTPTPVSFTDQDDLVILIGEGVRQVFHAKPQVSRQLRATPHAVTLPSIQSEMARVWYGRMVLPPPEAIHPQHDETFGRIRELLAQPSQEQDAAVTLGCSSTASSEHRQLDTTACEEGTLYCWHRCMSLADFNVNETHCANQDLDLMCINPRGQLWDNTHGDFFPGCVDKDTAEINTAFPTLPDYPRDEMECMDFETFAMQGSYDHAVHIAAPREDDMDEKDDMDHEDIAVMRWTLHDDYVQIKFAYNGLFGWIGLGLQNPGGKRNGMHGANVIMALPGGDYSAVTGLDLTQATTVKAYQVHPREASFRHWQTPLGQQEQATSRNAPLDGSSIGTVETTDCYTSMEVEVKAIGDKALNLTGTDHLIWATNGLDYFVGYHPERGNLHVEWATGKAAVDGFLTEVDDQNEGDHSDQDQDAGNMEDEDIKSSSASKVVGAALTVANLVAFVLAIFGM